MTAPAPERPVRSVDDVAAVADAAGLSPTGIPNAHWWRGPGVRVHCWPTAAFQVAIYAADEHGDHLWSAIYDSGTPAALLAHTIRAAQQEPPR